MKDKKLIDVVNTVSLPAQDAGSIEIVDIEGKGPFKYSVDHFHFHSAAEHTFQGKRHDLELHVVHNLVDGPDHSSYHMKAAVVGVVFAISNENHPFIEDLNPEDLENLQAADFNKLFVTEENKHYYHYKGSLTTPPCTDIVNWFLFKNVLPVRKELVKHLEHHWECHLGHMNYRAVQPLYGRKIARNFQ